MSLDFNPQFEAALTLLNEAKQHLFITGRAGTGKSTLLDYFCELCEDRPVVLAPTGVAALNVNGQTIHRFFNFYLDVTVEKILSKDTKPKDAKLYKQIRTIIIDEVSMLRADLLDCIDVFLQLYGPLPSQPFGGVQMVFVGDLYQLPPVVNKEEREIFSRHYSTPYFFSAKALQTCEIEILELEKIYRQKDQYFVELLNKIRNNSVDQKDIDKLNERYDPSAQKQGVDQDSFKITLTTTNAKADEINDQRLKALKGKIYTCNAEIEGDFEKEYFPTAPKLHFKVGAQIMLLNNDNKNRWVNGSIGKIEAIKSDKELNRYLRVRLREDNRVVSVYPHSWEVYKFSIEDDAIVSTAAGSFEQFPFRLAWAVTIHKSQGKTFDNVIIDIGKGIFAAGQSYVALSRCRSFEGIQLTVPFQKHHIRTDPQIYRFLTHHIYKAAEKKLPIPERIKIIQNAIDTQSNIKMVYQKPNEEKKEWVISPIKVGEQLYKGRVFPALTARINNIPEIITFHVGRILSLESVETVLNED